MRSRSRFYSSFPAPVSVRTLTRPGLPLNVQTNIYTDYYDRHDVISDQLRPKRSKEDRARHQRKLSAAARLLKGVNLRSVVSDLYTDLLTVNPCTHVKTTLTGPPETLYDSVGNSSNAFTYAYQNLGGLAHHINSGGSLDGLLSSLSGFTPINTASGFHGHDWFALLDSWHEACNNLITPTTNIGESMVEHDIFIDAFKTVLNPSRALKYGLNLLKETLGSRKHTPLGKIGRLLRETSDANLAFQFGVKPALEETKRVLTAHQKVAAHMKFLRSNVGGYIPIRARQILPSAVNEPNWNGNHKSQVIESRESVAVISALGKVRPDLDYAKDWHAYVQYFGLHKTMGLAWELIPFSFVLDWVTNAQEYVNKYLTPNYDSPFMNIRNICHSVRQNTTYAFGLSKEFLYAEVGFSRASESPLILGRRRVTSYERHAGLPTTSGSVDFSRLGLFHGITSGSLLIQKVGGLFKKS